jgi:hypothetical protein
MSKFSQKIEAKSTFHVCSNEMKSFQNSPKKLHQKSMSESDVIIFTKGMFKSHQFLQRELEIYKKILRQDLFVFAVLKRQKWRKKKI